MNIKIILLSITFILSQGAYANPSGEYIYKCLGAIDQNIEDHNINFNVKTRRFQYGDNIKSRVTHHNFRSRLRSNIRAKRDYFEEMKRVYNAEKSHELPVAQAVWIDRSELEIINKIEAINYAPRCRGLDGKTYKALKLKRAFLKEVLKLKKLGKTSKEITAYFTKSK